MRTRPPQPDEKTSSTLSNTESDGTQIGAGSPNTIDPLETPIPTSDPPKPDLPDQSRDQQESDGTSVRSISLDPLNPDLSNQPNGQQDHKTTIASTGLTLGTQTVPVAWAQPTPGDLVAIVGSDTLSVGGSVVTMQGHIISAAPEGLVVGSGKSASTLLRDSASENLVVIGGTTFTPQTTNGGRVLLQNEGTSLWLDVEGAATGIASQVVSAASSGVEVPALASSSGDSASATESSKSSLSKFTTPDQTQTSTGAETSTTDSGATSLGVRASNAAMILFALALGSFC